MFGVDGLFCRTRRPGTYWIPWKLHCDFLCQWLINESSNCWSFLPFVYWTHFRKMIFNHNKVLVYKVTKKPHEICGHWTTLSTRCLQLKNMLQTKLVRMWYNVLYQSKQFLQVFHKSANSHTRPIGHN